MRVLSLGAGVQSSTLLLMACEGDLKIDHAIFADTGWESKATYRYLDGLQLHASARGIPVHRVSAGDLRADALAGVKASWMPLFTIVDDDGHVQQLTRQCTRNYKIRPIRRKIRELGGGPSNPVDQLIGISLDEWTRMRTSDVAYITNVYPLVDLRMKRSDCINWMQERGYPIPPKSSCVGCPYRDNRSWKAMREGDQASWENAVDFDRRIRDVHTLHDEPVFVHRSGAPLESVDLRDERDRGQLDFLDECTGSCGV